MRAACIRGIEKLILILLVLALFVAGCAKKPAYDINSADDKVQEYTEWKYDGTGYVSAKEKSEVVTAHADASGKVISIEDAVTLKGISGSGGGEGMKSAVRDKSDLTELTNKNGDEAFEIKEGYIFFQNLGGDISYEGKGGKELPVKLGVKYYLNGVEKSADEIARKKGRVRVEYRLENNAVCEIEMDGETKRVHVPFVAISVVMLDSGSYSNLKTTNCKLSSFNSEEVIMAYTMPGMKRNIDTMAIDISSDDVPESFSFEMDTEGFKLGFSTTIVTSNLLDEDIDLEELSEVEDSLADLKSAGKKLADGSDKLIDGIKEFDGYLGKYVDGVDSLDSGIKELAKGAGTLDKSKADVYDGAKGMSDSLTAYNEAYAEIKPMLDAMLETAPDDPKLQAVMQWYLAMGDQGVLLAEGSAELAEGVKEFNKGITSLNDAAKKISKGSGALASQSDDLTGGYGSLLRGADEFGDGICEFYNEGIAELYDEGVEKINDIEEFIRVMEKADKGYSSYSGAEDGQDCRVTFIIETEAVE